MRYVPKTLRRLLRVSGVADRLRASRLFRAVQARRHPQRLAQILAEENFYRELLAPHEGSGTRLVFDVGANNGGKTVIFRRLGCRVVAVEPSPEMTALLRERFFSDPQVVIVEAAVSDRLGIAEFHEITGLEAYSSLNRRWTDQVAERTGQLVRRRAVETTTIGDLIARFGVPDYLKIDIEGHEGTAIQGLTRPVPLLSFEANLLPFEADSFVALERINEIMPDAVYNYCLSEPPVGWALPAWETSLGLRDALERTRPGYAEIYCRSRRDPVLSDSKRTS